MIQEVVKALLGLAIGVVGGMLALLVLCWLVGVSFGAFRLWRREGIGQLARAMIWPTCVGAGIVLIASVMVWGVSWLLDAHEAELVTSTIAGWSFVIGAVAMFALLAGAGQPGAASDESGRHQKGRSS